MIREKAAVGFDMIQDLKQILGPEWLRLAPLLAALIVSLLSAGVAIAVAAQIERSTGRPSFGLWRWGWVFYLINLMAALALEEVDRKSVV